jgi:hypothetical protein
MKFLQMGLSLDQSVLTAPPYFMLIRRVLALHAQTPPITVTPVLNMEHIASTALAALMDSGSTLPIDALPVLLPALPAAV